MTIKHIRYLVIIFLNHNLSECMRVPFTDRRGASLVLYSINQNAVILDTEANKHGASMTANTPNIQPSKS